jgi:ribosomal protein S20
MLGEAVMTSANERRSFHGAAELVRDSARATGYLKKVCAACEVGDKAAARRALRQAINELETAHAGLGIGMD